ncbi:peptidoglycan-binding protein [Streptomyces rimosus subsp. rimosus]|nr:peptidoglycan-binding protein [Streptomyces sp. NRRL WC-3701]KOT42373.1 peptidoglycan-binding protein [Streptomyces rimosus subsp. rimosus]KOT68672.1 peptidoglycan-binding protein [Streptomyces rimosus subsp. rimosus]KOT73369.1 peptidoglycan-binding protein [Streptomyces rimosus subsp. rimosus]KOT74828.1 peptidoglycan-binding protein [Streptomyces rimosus subsp. rimosus]
MSADRFLAALRAEGVRVVEFGSWRTHNRNSRGAWGPVHGVIVHHTVSSGTASSVQLCRDGYSNLPGPLCHGVIAKDGTVYLVGYGRANHAGGGCPAVLRQVTDESYGTAPSRPTRGNLDGTDGNHAFYGFECINRGDGADPWPAAQLDAIERVSAAICRAHSWGAKSVIGHLEWSKDKIDPRGFTMPAMRARVANRLAGKPGTPNPEEDDVSLTPQQAQQLAEIHRERAIAPWTYKGTDEPRDAYAYLRDTSAAIKAVDAKVTNLKPIDLTDEQMTKLAEKVASAPGLATAIAEAVAQKIADRLAE